MPRRLGAFPALPVLLAPAALAFSRGGYFDEQRLWAATVAWVLVAVVLVAAPRPLPAGRPGRAALAALAALTAWTGLSLLWAPLAGPAVESLQLGLLYLAALAAGVPLLREPVARRAVEPAMLATTVAAALYGLSERLLPGLVTLRSSAAAGDRLNQPLTYWNAMGALCALGLVLAAGLGPDRSRPAPLRAAAAATAAPLGLALYLTFSRGALGAAAAGLAMLVAVAPSRRTLLAVALAAGTAVVPVAATVVLPDLTAAGGSAAQGVAMIAVLAAAMAAAAVASARLERGRPGHAAAGSLRAGALAVIAAALAVSVIAAVRADRRAEPPPRGATAGRLVSAQSNRYQYWRVAVGGWADHPLIGGGAGSFHVTWLRERDIAEGVRDAHSLYLETAAELGLVGVAALAVLVAAAVAASRRALQRAGVASAAAVAAVAAWALHAGLDWDWEMPGLTLVALALLARLVAESEPDEAPASAAAAA